MIYLKGFDVGSGVRSRYAINEISRLHDALGSGYAWPYVNAEMLLLLSIHRAITDSGAQTAINVGAGFVIVGGLLLGLPALVSWLASPAAVGAVGGTGTVAGMYLERIKAFVGMGGDRVVSTGNAVPNSLNQKLSMQQVLSNPLQGATQIPITMMDPRWPASAGWVKMQQIIQHSDGTKTTIHFVYNAGRQLFADFKFINIP